MVEMCQLYIKGKLENTWSHKPFSLISVLDKEMVSPTLHLINKEIKNN